jgi:hypothetical protein
MNSEALISDLEKEWDFAHGFFGMLRRGIFDLPSLERLVRTLNAMDLRNDAQVNRRVVSLLWYMPLFMGWQRERVQENGGDPCEFDKAVNLVQSLVERLLGVP